MDKLLLIAGGIIALLLVFAFLPEICMIAVIVYIAYKLFFEESKK